jgi:hypothetical protein
MKRSVLEDTVDWIPPQPWPKEKEHDWRNDEEWDQFREQVSEFLEGGLATVLRNEWYDVQKVLAKGQNPEEHNWHVKEQRVNFYQ